MVHYFLSWDIQDQNITANFAVALPMTCVVHVGLTTPYLFIHLLLFAGRISGGTYPVE